MTKLHRYRENLLIAHLLTLLFAQIASAAKPLGIVPDPSHPGYYQPFHCLLIDHNVRGEDGAVRNNCGHNVEAYWQNGRGGWNSWTLPAGSLYSLFDGSTGIVLGCRPNEYLNRPLSLCKDSSYKGKALKDADRLTSDVGTGTAQGAAYGSTEADRLARELGVVDLKRSRGESPSLDAKELQASLSDWQQAAEERKRLAVQTSAASQEAEGRARADQRRAAVLASKTVAVGSTTEDTSSARNSECNGLLGKLGCVALATGKAAYEYKTGQLPLPRESGNVPAGDDPNCSKATAGYYQCENVTGAGMCGTYRAIAQCLAPFALDLRCPSVAAAARNAQRQAESNAAKVCEG